MKNIDLLSKIDGILKKKNFTREWLSREMGTTTQNVTTVLRTGNPKLSFCLKLSEVLQIPIFELFEINNKYINTVEASIIKEAQPPAYNYNNEIIKRLDKIINLLDK
jgi:transcriptional regulator with XRE-family HTH domain